MSGYKKHLFFCTNNRDNGKKCCAQGDAETLRAYAKQRVQGLGLAGKSGVRVNMSGCLGRCALGPALVIYPDGVWYRYENERDIDEILESHVVEGQVVERLLMPELTS